MLDQRLVDRESVAVRPIFTFHDSGRSLQLGAHVNAGRLLQALGVKYSAERLMGINAGHDFFVRIEHKGVVLRRLGDGR